jgi:hypothetical protein
MPYPGAARFEPFSGTSCLESAIRSGAVPPAPATAGVEPWPLPAIRETLTSGAPPPRISNDCKRRGAALGSATGAALGVDVEFDDLPCDRHLCRESESGRSEPS